jgi:hypothetical protein
MNIVIFTEDKGTKSVYKCWVPQVNPNITYVDKIFDILANNFTVISGFGYPHYLKIVEGVIDDINSHGNIDRLIIAVDSEDMTFQDKLNEITDYLRNLNCSAVVYPVIQFFCFETWALGNRSICSVNPNYPKLLEYKTYFDVRNNDPELLPPYPKLNLNRAQFAEAYLNAAFHNIRTDLSYNKSNPKPLCEASYFYQVRKRCVTDNQIQSFSYFLNALV